MNTDLFISLEVKECDYKGEHYSAREDGKIMRHHRDGMPKRKLDDVWIFGTPGAKGYLYCCGERVHRIVATAFHGIAPSEQHVVDHIDTNRRNNRPDNLRWLTKLQNTLINEITRKKVELICGSIEAYLKNPSLLYGHDTEDVNFSWMKNVTKEEADNCLENWANWAKTAKPNPNYEKGDSRIGNWIYKTPTNSSHTLINVHRKNKNESLDKNSFAESSESTVIDTKEWIEQTFGNKRTVEENKEEDDLGFDSLTSSAKQSWRTPTEFPCCPSEVTEDGLKKYHENLKKDCMFSKNVYCSYYVVESAIDEKNNILTILSRNNDEEGVCGKYSLARVMIEKGKYLHINEKRYGDKEIATHFYKLIVGEEEWTEEDWIWWDV